MECLRRERVDLHIKSMRRDAQLRRASSHDGSVGHYIDQSRPIPNN